MKRSGTKVFILGHLFVVVIIFLSFGNAHAQWAYTYGGTGRDSARAVQQTTDGGYIIGGWKGSAVWLLKLDDNGAITWQKEYGGTDYYDLINIQQTQDGGYVMAGSFNGDIWVVKLDSSGSITWQKAYGGGNGGFGGFVRQTQDGGYIVGGTTDSFGAGEYDFFILKLDGTGNIAWQKTYGGTGNEREPSIQQTQDGGYIVASRTDSYGTGDYDAWAVKLDANGDITWQKRYGGTGSDRGFFAMQTDDLGFIIVGQTDSFGTGDIDAWAVKLDANGDITWQKRYGGTGAEYFWSINQTQDGGYIVAGSTDSFSNGGKDAWLLKLKENGDITWQKRYGGTGEEYAQAVQQTDAGGYIVAGDTEFLRAGSLRISL